MNTSHRAYYFSEVRAKILSMAREADFEHLKHELGLRIRELRKKRQWTLEDAEEHGWPSWRHLQKIESGKNITLDTLYRLAKLFGISLSELFRGL